MGNQSIGVDIQPVPPNSLAGRMLTTKLSAPRLRPSLVHRRSLIETITAASAPVTLISAPAGYGKSTLVTHWLIQSGLAPAWVSLDANDNDPWTFFSLVTAAIQSIDPETATRTRSLLDGPMSPSAQAILMSLLSDLEETTRRFALVLDDYHVIEHSVIHDAVATLLLKLPPSMKVFLITRTEPPLHLSRLRGRQDVIELGPDELRFTNDEALELLQYTNGLQITQGEVKKLNKQAEGWVAGLQLVGHILRGQTPERIRDFTSEFSGNVRSIEAYLWEEVIGRQTDDVQLFLLQTSILDRFDASLCNAVTGNDDGAATIRLLEQERMFVVSLDDVGHWFRFHHLFADVLRERLAQRASEEEMLQLHRRAAAWLQDHGHTEDAARHAIVARDWDRATDLLEQVASELYSMDRNRLLYELLQVLPERELARKPQLASYLGFAMTRLGHLQDAIVPLRIAEEAWTLANDKPRLGLVRVTHALRSQVTQDAQIGIEHALQAIELIPADQPAAQALAHLTLGAGYLCSGETKKAESAFAAARIFVGQSHLEWQLYTEMAFSSGVLVQQGKLQDALVLLRRVGILADHSNAIQYQHALFRLGDINYELNLLDESDRNLRLADELAEETHTLRWRGPICLCLAKTAWARGDTELAFGELDRAIGYANQIGWNRVAREAKAQQARFWLSAGQLALAHRWAESCELDPYLKPAYERQVEHLTFIRLLIAEGKFEIAIKLIDQIRDQASAYGRFGDLVEISVLEALSHKVGGDNVSALRSLDMAFEMGEPSGYVRAFADEGEAVLPLLRHAVVRGNHREYAKQLLEQSEGGAALVHENRVDGHDSLSEREIEVMRLVAAGLPNKDIGERLYISEKTVKKHLSRILAKLGTTNRMQATEQARKLNLI